MNTTNKSRQLFRKIQISKQRFAVHILLMLLAAMLMPQMVSAQNLYWNVSGMAPSGTWDGISLNWSTNGTGGGPATNWTAGNTAIFSAGTAATGSYTITLSGTQNASGVSFADGTATLSGGNLLLTGSGNVAVTTGLNGFIASSITGSVGLTKTSSGNLVLQGANTFTSNLTNRAGTITLNNNQAAGAGAIVLNPNSPVALHSSVPSTTLTNNISLLGSTSTIEMDADSGNFLVLGGLISGSHNWSANGLGTLELAGTSPNTFGGVLTVSQGTLLVAADGALGNTANAVVVSNGATLSFDGNITYSENQQITLNGSGVGGGAALDNSAGDNTFQGRIVMGANSLIGAQTGSSLTLTGSVTGGYNLTKVGNGEVVLGSDLNSYASTLVSAGTLDIASGANGGSGLVTVSSGATFAGEGSVASGGIDLSGTISPGDGLPATLSSSSETWEPGGSYAWTINDATGTPGSDPGYAQLDASGTLTINATPSSPFVVHLSSLDPSFESPGNAADFDDTATYNWTIATASGGITGFDPSSFSIDASGFSNPLGNGAFILQQSGNSIVLSFVQKPQISTGPASQTVARYGSVTFNVIATGTATLHYQWFDPNNNPVGTDSSSFSINNLAFTDAGTYRVVVSNLSGYTATASAVLSVVKATPTVTASGGAFTYNGQPHAGTGSATGGAGETLNYTLSYAGTIAGGASYGPTATAPAAAGAYTVTASTQGDLNNYSGSSTPATLTINPAAVTVVSGLMADNKAYDGTNTATISSNNVVLSGVLSADAANVSLSTNGYTADFSQAAAGTDLSVTVGGLSLTGSASGNYVLIQPTDLTANITPYGLTITGVSAQEKTYDTTTAATLTGTPSLVGVVGSDDVSLDPSATPTAAFGDPSAGVNKAVTVSGYALTGGAAGNYTLTQPSGLTATIDQAPLTVTASATGKTYDATTTESSGNVTLNDSPLGSDAVQVSFTSASFDNANAGTAHTVTVSGIAITGGAQSGDYVLDPVADAGGVTTVTGVPISQLPISVTAVTDTKTYDGGTSSSQTPTFVAGTYAANNLPGTDTPNFTQSFDSAAAGSRTLTPAGLVSDGNSGNNYAYTYATASGQINPKPVTVTANSGQSKVYGQSDPAFTYSADPLIGSDSYSGALSRDPGETVGNYAIRQGGLTAGGNYSITFNSASFGITPLGVTITGVSAANKTYDGTATANLSGGTIATLLAGDSANVTIVTGSGVFGSANAGTWAVTSSGYSLTGAAAFNYSLTAQPVVANATIAPAAVTVVSGLMADNKAYDGTNTATISSNNVVLSGVLSADAANVSLSTNGYTADFSQAAAGTDLSVTVGGLSLTGSASGNYVLIQPTDLTANITPYGLTITGVSAQEKTYDTTTAATLTGTPSLVGVVGSDDVSLDPSATPTAAFGDPSAGVNKAVTVSGYALTGGAAGNYTLTQPSGLTATIDQAPLTVTASATGKTYDATTTESSGNVTLNDSPLGSDAVQVSFTSASFDNANAGTAHTVTVSGIAITGGAQSGDYVLDPVADAGGVTTVTGVPISQLPISVTAVTDTKTYDGGTSSSQTPTFVAGTYAANNLPGTDTPNFTQSFDSAAAGSRTLTPAGLVSDGNSGNNYAYTYATASGQINPKPVTVTANSGQSKVYGQSDPAFTYSADPLIGSDSYSGALSRDPGETVGNYAIRQGGLTAGGNYSITFNSASFGITPLGVTITGVSAANKTYDGTATANLSGGTIATLLAGDSANVTIVTGSGVFGSANAGTWAVTSSGYSLTGAAAFNYSLTAQPVVANATIAPAAVTVVSGLMADNKAYDGTNTATISSNNVVLSGVLSADAANVSLSTNGYTADFSQAAAGTDLSVTVGGLSLTGSASGNYVLIQPTDLTANITPYGLTITGVSAQEKTYDTTTAATLTGTPSLVGVVGSDDVSLDPSATPTAAFGDPSAGVNKAVTVSGYALTGGAAGNYTLTQPSGLTATIDQAPLTVTASATGKTYDATTTESSGNVTLNDSPLGSDAVQVSFTSASFDNANAGTAHTVTVSGIAITGGAQSGDYVLDPVADAGGVTTVTGVPISQLPISVTAVTDTKTYDGGTSSSQTPTFVAGTYAANNLPGTDTPNFTQSFDSAAAGSRTLTPAGLVSDGNSGNNYAYTYATASGQINPKPVTVTANSGQSKVYGQSDPAFTYSADPLIGSDSYSGALSRDPGETVGNYAIRQGGLTAGGNYSITFNSASFGITPLGVTITGVSAANKTYDGTATANLSGGTIATLLAGDSANVTIVTGSGVFGSANAGTWAVTSSGYSLTGAAAFNYSLTAQPVVANATIAPAAVTVVSGLMADNKAYDGTNTATISSNNVVLSGVLSADAANVSLSTNGYTADFSQAAAGTDLSVTVGGLSLTGSASGNYVLIQPTDLTANITPYGLTITGVSAQEKTYDTTTAATLTGTPSLVGVVGSDDVSLDPSATPTAAFGDPSAGVNKAVTVSGYALTGGAAGNYTLTQPSGLTATIDQAPLTVTASATGKTYDATTTESSGNVTLNDSPLGSDAVQVSFTSASFDNANAGTAHTVTVSGIAITGGAQSGDYVLDPVADAGGVTTVTGVPISQLPISVTAVTDTKTYDGGTSSSQTPTFVAGTYAANNLPGTDTPNFTQSFDSAAAGSRTLTPAGLVSDGNSGNNYAYTYATASGQINPKPVTVTGASVISKIYDGTTVATISGATLSGVLGNDVVALGNATSGTYATKNVGEGIAVSTAMTISGGDTGNYTLAQPALTGNITPAPLTITANSTNKVYGTTLTFAGTEFTHTGTLYSSDSITSVALTSSGAVSNAVEGNYAIVPTNAVGTGVGNYAIDYVNGTLAVVAQTPVITSISPVSQTNNATTTASFAVSVTGAASYTNYQWFKITPAATNVLTDGGNISGSTSDVLTITNVLAADQAEYAVTVSNAAGAATTNGTLVVIDPAILVQPFSVTNNFGSTVNFSVTAAGTAPLSYQWQQDGFNLPGETGTNLTITDAQDSDEGNYTVVISNSAGQVLSDIATLTLTHPPVIVAQPSSSTVNQGATATFTVSVNGATPFTYQWFKNSSPLSNGGDVSGATNRELILTGVTSSNAASYYVAIANTYGETNSQPATLIVIVPPAMTTQPIGLTNNAGTTASFSATASGTAPSFQWYQITATATNALSDGGKVSGSMSNVLTINNVLGADSASYYLVASNQAGEAVSSNAILVVNDPIITNEPASLTVNLGSPASFSVGAYGTSLHYQWYTNGIAISGANAATYAIASAADSNAASYTVVVTNIYGGVTNSPPAILTVIDPPVVTSQPHSQTVNSGGTATFTVGYTGTAPSFQWYQGAAPIGTGTNATLSLTDVQDANAGAYSVVLNNAAGTVTSSNATLTVIDPPVITSQPLSRTNNAGTTATFTVSAGGTAPFAYQWYLVTPTATNLLTDGGNISGSGSNVLSIASVLATNQADYFVTVTNPAGVAVSSNALLGVIDPAILVQPVGSTNFDGSTVAFSVAAAGTATLNYQWYQDSVPVYGATSNTLILTNIADDDAGNYTVVVTNLIGSVTSAPALLVTVAPLITAQPTNVTVIQGQPASFSVSVNGETPFSYQWLLNGTNVTAATGTNRIYALTHASTSDAGNYQVIVTDPIGSQTSAKATLSVYLTAAPTLTLVSYTNHQATINLVGVPTFSYSIQASSNLVDWVPLVTNTSPITFTDTNRFGYQYYRGRYLP